MSFYKSAIIGSSEDETWRTPKGLYDELNSEFNFSLDVAALQSSTLVKDNWYGPDHPDVSRRDGLARDWHKDATGVAWMNPPYGRDVTSKWLRKAVSEAERGLDVMCLIPARPGAYWFHDHCFPHRIRFIRGRLKFNDGLHNAPFDSALVWIKQQPDPGYF